MLSQRQLASINARQRHSPRGCSAAPPPTSLISRRAAMIRQMRRHCHYHFARQDAAHFRRPRPSREYGRWRPAAIFLADARHASAPIAQYFRATLKKAATYARAQVVAPLAGRCAFIFHATTRAAARQLRRRSSAARIYFHESSHDVTQIVADMQARRHYYFLQGAGMIMLFLYE